MKGQLEKYRIKVVHLLTVPDSEREKMSVQNVQSLDKVGFQYVQHVNTPFSGTVPRPDRSSALREESLPGAYGCYWAHRKAIEEEFDEDTDFLLICECDCLLTPPLNRMPQIIEQACDEMLRWKVDIVSLGFTDCCYKAGMKLFNSRSMPFRIKRVFPSLMTTNWMRQSHCLLVSGRSRQRLQNAFARRIWDAVDVWYSRTLWSKGKIGYIKQGCTRQVAGESLIKGTRTAYRVRKERFTPAPSLPLFDTERFSEVRQMLAGRRVFFGRPKGSTGDGLIHAGTRCLFKKIGTRIVPNLRAADVCVWGGGGNLGTFYRNAYQGRASLFAEARELGLPIVILPQSMVNEDDQISGATVFAREHKTLSLVPGSILAPDMSFAYDGPVEWFRPVTDCGVFMRDDRESVKHAYARFSLGDPAQLTSDYRDYFVLISPFRKIVTDRLHFAIASLMMKRTTVLVSNSYFKNQAMYEAWLKDMGCLWSDGKEIEHEIVGELS